MAGLDFWTGSVADSVAAEARRLEDEGWDGILWADTQSLVRDCYVELAIAATATSRLKVQTFTTNPITRHPAVTAGAIASIHAESGGRAVLGIARGDSSLAHIGLAPAPLPHFARYLERVQGYLRGDKVPFDLEIDASNGVRSSDTLGMAGGPTEASELRWLHAESVRSLRKVSVEVAASGPRVISLAGRLADGVVLAVGTSPERVSWAIEVARSARVDAGLDPDNFVFGLHVPVLVHNDRSVAQGLISGIAASLARFSVMHGTVVGPTDARLQGVLRTVHATYDMDQHFTHGSPQSKALDAKAIDAFAIAGPPAYCAERLLELAELGISKFFVIFSAFGLDPTITRRAHQSLVEDVLPELRRTSLTIS